MAHRYHTTKKQKFAISAVCCILLLTLTSIGSFITRLVLEENVDKSLPNLAADGVNQSRVNCTADTIDAFPDGVFTPSQLSHGAFLLNIAVGIYMFGVLAIVCDSYYVPSLEVICQKLKLSQDVAGATFMAAGSSAPELFTSVIGVCVAKGDIGLGTIIGSAVFNLYFIIGLCGLLTSAVIQLKWWAVTRDCICYLISVGALVGVMQDSYIKWYEGLTLLGLYITYIFLMFNNHRIERLVIGSKSKVTSRRNDSERAPLLSDKEDLQTATSGYTSEMEDIDHSEPEDGYATVVSHTVQGEPEDSLSPFQIPKERWITIIMWVLYLPPSVMFYFTIPNCQKEKWNRWFPVTFVVSLIWIGISSYVLVWMANTVGITFGIPDVVLGYTVLAVGNSVPDALASVMVARNGYGDMAISNSIGSNIFDILLCLGLPWFLQTAVIDRGSEIDIHNSGSWYMAIMLFGTVFILLLLFKVSKFKLGKILGAIFLGMYTITISLGIFIETYLFSSHLPEC
ncbi:Sodium/potassium/calcium exchanger 5 [Holothuria leucospilota]|uniref:Sodium/potassium/calcium exchanger 5 n=1 Tax=Holothuria leucospilota TaxID=206669 RepID=A0A9Q1BM00_HOLLE|nr:Sodium/potassium/calcium exchanger 5 [Holothuria leucospilota]